MNRPGSARTRRVRGTSAGGRIVGRSTTTGPRNDPTASPLEHEAGLILGYRLEPPRSNRNHIDRDGLTERLFAGLGGRLTAICAPAGYGKTGQLAQFRAKAIEKGLKVAWLSCDECDADVAAFADLIRAALAQDAAPGRPLPDDRHVGPVARILTALDEEHRTVLILDDLHLIASSGIIAFIHQLLRAAPPRLHVIVASREAAPLQTAKLLDHGLLAKFGIADLRLTREEIARVLGEEATALDLSVVEAKTEGWPAAVQILGDAIKGRAHADQTLREFSGAEGPISTYIRETILAGLTASERRLLASVSVVDEICGDLARVLGSRDGDGRLLCELADRGTILLPGSQGPEWVRLHPLVAQYLRSDVRRHGDENWSGLHLVAAQWFYERDRLADAVRMCCLVGEADRAAAMVEGAGGIAIATNRNAAELDKVIANFPGEYIDSCPTLRAARMLRWYRKGRIAEAESEYQDLTIVANSDGSSGSDLHHYLAVMKISLALQRDILISADDIREYIDSVGDNQGLLNGTVSELQAIAFLRSGDADRAAEVAERALLLRDDHSLPAARVYTRIHLGIINIIRGRPLQAHALLIGARELAFDGLSDDLHSWSILSTLIGVCLYQSGKDEAAWNEIESAIDTIDENVSWTEIFHFAYTFGARALFFSHSFDAAKALIHRAKQVAVSRQHEGMARIVKYMEIDILTLAGAEAAGSLDLEKLLSSYEAETEGMVMSERDFIVLSLARLAVRRDRPELAIDIVDRHLSQSERRGRIFGHVGLLIVKAMALRAIGELGGALDITHRAISLAADNCLYRCFVEEGGDACSLVDQAMRRTGAINFTPAEINLIAHVLAARGATKVAQSVGDKLLSERERDILQGISDGLSNKQIARRLNLGEDGVKYHLKRLFAKLGVVDRSMAAMVACQHGLLGEPNEAGAS